MSELTELLLTILLILVMGGLIIAIEVVVSKHRAP